MRINLEDINPNFGEHISSIVFGLEVVVVEVVCSIYFCSQWGGQEMMVDACLKMGYPKFPWVINVYHPFPPKEESIDVNCIGGQELLNNSWKGSTWISRIRKSWDLRSKCGGVLAEQSGQSPLEYDGTLHLHVVGPDVATVRIFWDRISGSFQRESNDFMAVNLGIPNVQTNEDKASWSLVLECSW